MNETPSPPSSEVIEVSLSDIFGFFKRNWLILFFAGLLSGAAGYGISHLIAPQFEATAKILPEFGSGTGAGGLSDLASLAGFSLGKSSSDALRPDLYPSILSSKTFLMQVLSTPFPLQNGEKIVLASYLDEEAQPLSPQQLAQGDTLITLSKEQERVMKDVAARITASMDKMSGVISIRAEMPDPTLAAACATYTLSYLKTFVGEYRGGKKAEKVAFLRTQVNEAKGKYQRTEVALNAYRDRNRSAFTNMAQVEEQRLQNDYLQAQTLYGELTRQLEAARLQALEEAPVLKVLEPPMIPNWKSKPKRSLYALGFAILGGFLVLIVLLFVKEKIHHKFG
ncbi:GumC domain-containing protein [Arundinibacter roseus]|nr:lipopolysaccharide biosynthesis protein [Arundinibacter roseus]